MGVSEGNLLVDLVEVFKVDVGNLLVDLVEVFKVDVGDLLVDLMEVFKVDMGDLLDLVEVFKVAEEVTGGVLILAAGGRTCAGAGHVPSVELPDQERAIVTQRETGEGSERRVWRWRAGRVFSSRLPQQMHSPPSGLQSPQRTESPLRLRLSTRSRTPSRPTSPPP